MEKRLYQWFYKQRTGYEYKDPNASNDIEGQDAPEPTNSVSYRNLREEARKIADELGISSEEFLISDKWIFGFCKRHHLGTRRYTHRGQADKRSMKESATAVIKHLEDLPVHTGGFDQDKIFNMDETPCFFDMAGDSTIHFKGEKNVDGVDTGHRKSRFTTVIAASASGRMLKALIILKGLKKTPELKLPKNIIVTVAPKGSMNSELMQSWLKSCFSSRGPYFAQTKSLLLMDSYGSHRKPEVINTLKSKYNTTTVFIPPKTTHILQPMDVAVNSPFKAALRGCWENWFRNGEKVYTAKGYRKRPSYQEIVDMVSISLDAIKEETIKKAFRCCGIAEKGQVVPLSELNSRLRGIVSFFNKGIVENPQLDPFQGLEEEDDDDGDESDGEEVVEVEQDAELESAGSEEDELEECEEDS